MSKITTEIKNIIRSEISKLRIPHAQEKVYKDECIYSFDSPFVNTGLYVNLNNFQGVGKDYLLTNIKKTGCKLYLHEVWNQVFKKAEDDNTMKKSDVPVSKLAIGVEGGFQTEKQFDIMKDHYLVVVMNQINGDFISIPLPDSEIPEYVLNVIQAVIDHAGTRVISQVNAWDAENDKKVSKYAMNLVQLPRGDKKISHDPKTWVCEESGATDNLWLNLSTGYIGGGRKNWDGTGGSGAALNHFNATGKKYPLAVKLGTITPHGADVWSYAEDENNLVIDPLLPEHLSYWGIDVMKLEKTDQTISELEVALNQSYDWSKLLDGQEQIELVNGPGLIGLQNIGSSCYMNSIIQAVLSLPEVQQRYYQTHVRIVDTAPSDPTSDFPLQMSKLAVGVLSSRYVVPLPTDKTSDDPSWLLVNKSAVEAAIHPNTSTTPEKYVIAPYMFKQLIGKGHPEFSTSRQQDVAEFFMYLLDFMNRSERINLPRITHHQASSMNATVFPTSSIFEFHLQNRYECQVTGQVLYSKLGPQSINNIFDLPIPLEKAINRVEVEEELMKELHIDDEHERKRVKLDEKSEDEMKEVVNSERRRMEMTKQAETKVIIPFEACFQAFFQPEEVSLFHPTIGQPTPRNKTTRFHTFPRYLMVKLARYYVGENWVQVKINAQVPMPEQLELSSYKTNGLQENEVEVPIESSIPSQASTVPMQYNQELISELMAMGFSENGCKRAALATNNGSSEVAMNWIFEHMEDADFNEAPNPSDGSASTTATEVAVDAGAMEMLQSMGYSAVQTKAALMATDQNIERAADWLFSHADDLDSAVAQVMGTETNTIDNSKSSGNPLPAVLDGDQPVEGKYTLKCIISHIGKNTDHGHYICHIKKEGQWYLFNDEKVGKAVKPPIEYGFMYLYERCDNPTVM